VQVPKKSGSTRPQLQYYGQGKKSRKWEERRAYGGLLAENVTQAVARDILVEAMLRMEAAGYPIVLHVHDEAVAEVPEHFGSKEEFERILCASPPWGAGLPIAASAWTGIRYQKG
jgi:DNA polymerase